MLTYDTTVINVPKTNVFEWKEYATDIFFSTEAEICTIQAPRLFGKTDFAIDIILCLCSQEYWDPKNILYVASDRNTLNTMKKTLVVKSQFKFDSIDASGYSRIVFRLKNDSRIFTATNIQEVNISKGIEYDLIVVDDADRLNNIFLHSLVVQSAIQKAKLLCLGNTRIVEPMNAENHPGKRIIKKDIWQWLQHHPSAETIIVRKATENNVHLYNDALNTYDNFFHLNHHNPLNFIYKRGKYLDQA